MLAGQTQYEDMLHHENDATMAMETIVDLKRVGGSEM